MYRFFSVSQPMKQRKTAYMPFKVFWNTGRPLVQNLQITEWPKDINTLNVKNKVVEWYLYVHLTHLKD